MAPVRWTSSSRCPDTRKRFLPDGKCFIYHTATALPMAMLRPFGPGASSKPLVRHEGTDLSSTTPRSLPMAAGSPISPTSPDGSRSTFIRFRRCETGRWQISADGGAHPLWSRNGRELFFIDGKGTLISVAVRSGSTFNRATEHSVVRGRSVLRRHCPGLRRDERRHSFSFRQERHGPSASGGRRRGELVRRSAREDGSSMKGKGTADFLSSTGPAAWACGRSA